MNSSSDTWRSPSRSSHVSVSLASSSLPCSTCMTHVVDARVVPQVVTSQGSRSSPHGALGPGAIPWGYAIMPRHLRGEAGKLRHTVMRRVCLALRVVEEQYLSCRVGGQSLKLLQLNLPARNRKRTALSAPTPTPRPARGSSRIPLHRELHPQLLPPVHVDACWSGLPLRLQAGDACRHARHRLAQTQLAALTHCR